jgi:hypothetical protein
MSARHPGRDRSVAPETFILTLVGAVPAQARPTVTHYDQTGALTRSIDELIARGRHLPDRASTIAVANDLSVFRGEHRAWVLECLPVLAAGFEPESVGEFIRVNSRVLGELESAAVAKTAVTAMRDALELLEGLRDTLRRDPRR